MRARFASRCRSCAVRLAGASAVIGTLSSLFPAIAAFAVTPAAASAHPYAAIVTEAAQRFDIPEAWVWAVMRAESNGDPAAISHAGAMGLMQIMPGTWAELAARYGLGDNPWDVRANIHGGAAYLREMVDRYRDLNAVLAAYNAGPGRVDDWLRRRRPLPAETVAYVAKVAPFLGGADIASPTVLAAVSRAPVAPSWRDAALFALRSDRRSDARDAAPSAQPGETAAAQPARPSGSSSSHAASLFAAISGNGER